jgi:peptidyl-prolyl cis-trans isomerase D
MRSVAKYVWWFLVVAFVGSFLLYETSGLAGRAPVTTSTAVATVNGDDILLTTWQNAVNTLEQQEQQRIGRSVTLDERRILEDRAFDELVNDLLLQQEYKRRGITVTDDEIIEAARYNPPPQARTSPELQTEGVFDIQKYQRLLASPTARQSGMLIGLQNYYQAEIPKQKLFDQIASDVYVSDARLLQIYKDRHDSAQVSFVVLRTESLTDTAVTVTDAEISQFYARNTKRFEHPGRAVVSLLSIPRTISAADSAAAKARIEALRAEITGGAKFEDVAKSSSMDSVSGANGGDLGKGARGRFTPTFEDAAYALKTGELSQPVLTPFGWHLIRVDERKGDTLSVRHILVNIAQTDSSALRTDRRADSLANKAANLTDAKLFDQAAKELGLTPNTVTAIEKEAMTFAGRLVPSVSAWSFSGVQVGESSDLFDSPDAYYVARLDSLFPKGVQPLSEVQADIRRRLEREKRLEKLRPLGEELLKTAKGSSLDAAAASRSLTVETSPMFSRIDLVPGLGQFTQAIGAAFTIPVGQLGGPALAVDGMAILRVDRRVEADVTAFEAQKAQQRAELISSMRQQRVEEFLTSLRESVKVQDHRTKVNMQLRRQSEGV